MVYNWQKIEMKKILLLFAAVVAGIALTSFVTLKQSATNNGMSNDWIYYTCVTAWTDATESQTIYIYYKEGNGVRKYTYENYKFSSDEIRGTCIVSENEYYRDSNCKDFRRKYRWYVCGLYFNANLPYMQKR